MPLARTAVLMLFLSAFLSRCASILSPTGGPRDSLPPVIIAITPDNYTTNFDTLATDKKIYIEFDEFVQIKDQQKEFYTSPAMKKNPTINTRGRGIVITLKDTLKPNTTYAINFGSSIRDNNEGNPLNAMRYVLSTGPTIDSMIMSGYTADSYKVDSVGKSFIYFFIADSLPDTAEYDSTMFNHKPAAIARAENNGIFIAQNLKPIDYRVYAYKDTNDNQMYEPGTDQIGFLDGTYNPLSQPDFGIWYDSLRKYPSADPQLYFRMFTDVAFKRQIMQETQRPLQHKALLYFGAPYPEIESVIFDSIPSDSVILENLSVTRDTVAVWLNMRKESIPDTLRTVVSYYKHDSLSNLVLSRDTIKLTWKFFETKEQEKEREKLEKERQAALEAGEEWIDPTPNPFKHNLKLSGELNPEQPLTVDFDYPLVRVDSAQFSLTKMAADSTIINLPLDIERDTMNLRRWYLRSTWGEVGDKLTLTIPKGAMRDVAGFSNDSISGSYTMMDPEKYATVVLNLTSSDSQTDYIVQLLNASNKLIEEKRGQKSGTTTFKYVPAGEIRLRIVEDKNGNGVWDTGNLVEARQPERSELYSRDGEDTFETKANWEVEENINLDALFAPVTMESLINLLDEREEQRLEKERKKQAEDAAKKAQQGQQGQGQQGGGSSSGGFGLGSGLSQIGGL